MVGHLSAILDWTTLMIWQQQADVQNGSCTLESFSIGYSEKTIEGVVAPWCNPLTLQPEQSGGVGLSPGRAPPLERHDKGSQTRLGLLYLCDPSAWR